MEAITFLSILICSILGVLAGHYLVEWNPRKLIVTIIAILLVVLIHAGIAEGVII